MLAVSFTNCQSSQLLYFFFFALNTGCYQLSLPLTSNCSQPAVGLGALKCVSLLFQGVTKGLVAEKIFTSMAENGKRADFVLCIGDDRSDEDMFEIIGNAVSRNILSSYTSIFACTVGQKPSKAKYYLDDTTEVIAMLESLAEFADSPASSEEDSDGSP